jgi:hypothetical protein
MHMASARAAEVGRWPVMNVTPLCSEDDAFLDQEHTMNELVRAYLAWKGICASPDRGDKDYQIELFDDWQKASAKFVTAHKKFSHWLEYHREQQKTTE